MIVVSNSTPIISLSSIGYTSILKDLFHEVHIPLAVYNEIRKKKFFGYEEIENSFFIKEEVQGKKYLNFLMRDLDAGESEAILLSKEIGADLLLIDERLGLQIAKNEGLECIGTLSILRLAKERNLISEIRPLLYEMKVKGRWYSDTLMEEFLKKVGEH